MTPSGSSDDLGGELCEVLLWMAGLGFAACVSQGLFFLLPLGLALALLAAFRIKGVDWTLLRFGWLYVILLGTLGAVGVALIYAAVLGRFS